MLHSGFGLGFGTGFACWVRIRVGIRVGFGFGLEGADEPAVASLDQAGVPGSGVRVGCWHTGAGVADPLE